MTGVAARTIGLAVACLVLLMASRSQWSPEPAVRLVYPNPYGNVGHATVTDIAPGGPLSFGGIPLCTWPPGVVEITGVRMYGGSGDTSVVAFGVRPNPNAEKRPMLGETIGPLDQLGFDTDAPATVGTRCTEDLERLEAFDLTEFAVQIERPSANTTTFDGMLVDYTHDTVRGTAIVSYGITLCGDEDRTTKRCP